MSTPTITVPVTKLEEALRKYKSNHPLLETIKGLKKNVKNLKCHVTNNHKSCIKAMQMIRILHSQQR